MSDAPDYSVFISPSITWSRGPLGPNLINRVFAATSLPLAIPAEQHGALRLTASKAIDLAYWPVIHSRQALPSFLAQRYTTVFAEFSRLSVESSGYFGSPPEIPEKWKNQTADWGDELQESKATRGRPLSAGDETFFRIMLALYQLAFARTPSPAPTGPTIRFFRAFNEAMAEALFLQPRQWPRLSKGVIIAGIRKNRASSESEYVTTLFANCVAIPYGEIARYTSIFAYGDNAEKSA